MPRKKLGSSDVRDIAMALPGVQQGVIHGAPSFKVGGKLLTCPALHKSADSESWVVRIGPAERAKLMKAGPDTYYLTPHYSKYPMILVRLDHIDRKSLRSLLEKSWSSLGAKKGATKPKPRTKRRPPSR